jgi:pyrroloquinoline quinone biosynthesis protein E
MIAPPLALLAELTHRCPLRCPYCSNPTTLARRSEELDAATWGRVFSEAAALGCLQVHLSGGEPLARRDFLAILASARAAGLYTNLITSGALPGGPTPAELAAAGLDHLQLSVQDADAAPADRIGGLAGAHARKLGFAKDVRAAGLALTLNVVVHRQNLTRLEALIGLAVSLGAARLEIAHAQYHGWALLNRDALLPDRAAVEQAVLVVEAARVALRGRLAIDHVPPDYHAQRPKSCMGGWGRRFMVVTPAGRVLPCHSAETLPGFEWPNVRTVSLDAAWRESDAFNRFRGTGWMRGPCRSCPEAERDWGGCRCQAHALTGDATATDPACALSPHHGRLAVAVGAAAQGVTEFRPRQ